MTAPPGPPHIRALFLDMDGTVIGHDEVISDRVLDSLERARSRGCEVVLCTGRARFTAMPIAAQLRTPPRYLVCSNGGVVLDVQTGEAIRRCSMPIPTALELVRALMALGAEPYVYEDSIVDDVERARVLYHPDLPVGPWATRPRYRAYPGIDQHLPFEPASVATFGPPDRIRPLVPTLRAMLPDTVSLIESGTDRAWGIEIFPAGVCKRAGLEAVAERLGIGSHEIMAVGDHANDLDMIAWAGIGVAMGNALPEVKEAADWVTGTLSEDGVAQAVERFVLAAGTLAVS